MHFLYLHVIVIQTVLRVAPTALKIVLYFFSGSHSPAPSFSFSARELQGENAPEGRNINKKSCLVVQSKRTDKNTAE